MDSNKLRVFLTKVKARTEEGTKGNQRYSILICKSQANTVGNPIESDGCKVLCHINLSLLHMIDICKY